MTIVIEEIVSSYPVVVTEEVVQITIAETTSFLSLIDVDDKNYTDKEGFVPTVENGKLKLKASSGGGGGDVGTIQEVLEAGSEAEDVDITFTNTTNDSQVVIDSERVLVRDELGENLIQVEKDNILVKNNSGGSTKLIFESTTSDVELIVPNSNSKLATETYVDNKVAGERLITAAEITKLSKTTAQINAIVNPLEGEQYFNTTLKAICFYNGSAWRVLSNTNM